jgi:DNA-binding transcriptional regulator GbsR (MarR family)
MAAELQMSKSGASVAGRLLETWALARRTGERGSRRVLHEASDNLEAMITANNRGAQDFIDVCRQGRPSPRLGLPATECRRWRSSSQ